MGKIEEIRTKRERNHIMKRLVDKKTTTYCSEFELFSLYRMI